MWATHLTLINFRGFESLELDLDRPVTVLVGANGSGKTSVLRAIVAPFYWLRAGGLEGGPGIPCGLDTRDRRVGAGTTALRLHCSPGTQFKVRFPENRGVEVSVSPRGLEQVRDAFAFLVSTDRGLASAGVEGPGIAEADPALLPTDWEDVGVVSERPGYARFLAWFKEREDVENEARVAGRDFTLQDPQLRAVREAVAALMPGFDDLRIQRSPRPAMVVKKAGAELRLDQLSDGERNLIALAGDLARRLAIHARDTENPRELACVILIDEIEQHLHPAWQRQVIPALRSAFPKAQLIVTTHSPQVLSSVPASAVVLLDGFSAHALGGATEGRDSNAILREVFGVPERPQPQLDEVRAIRSLLDGDDLDAARDRLDALAARLSEQDDEVVALRMRLHVAEA